MIQCHACHNKFDANFIEFDNCYFHNSNLCNIEYFCNDCARQNEKKKAARPTRPFSQEDLMDHWELHKGRWS